MSQSGNVDIREIFFIFWPVGGSSPETLHGHFEPLILYDHTGEGRPSSNLCVPPPPTGLADTPSGQSWCHTIGQGLVFVHSNQKTWKSRFLTRWLWTLTYDLNSSKILSRLIPVPNVKLFSRESANTRTHRQTDRHKHRGDRFYNLYHWCRR